MSFFKKKGHSGGKYPKYPKIAYTQFDKLHNLQALKVTTFKAKRDSLINRIYCSVLDTA
jgi:hypothetical protein